MRVDPTEGRTGNSKSQGIRIITRKLEFVTDQDINLTVKLFKNQCIIKYASDVIGKRSCGRDSFLTCP